VCEGDGGRREGWKNKAVNGAPCHWSYGKKHRMNWKNERRVQKGAEGKEKTSPTTCLSASHYFFYSPSYSQADFWEGDASWSCLATDMFLFSERKCTISRI